MTPLNNLPRRQRVAAFPWFPPVAAACLIALVACGGGGGPARSDSGDARAELRSMQFGRLVDVYAYQRIDESSGQRRDRFNRRAVLLARNVVISPTIESQPLFDASGEEIVDTDYEFRPFDSQTGHEELLILWDNRPGPERERFLSALARAQEGLIEIPASYREQPIATRPIPVVPRNAAIKLTFSSQLSVTEEFFRVNPAALQVLEFKGDPRVVSPVEAFRSIPVRILVQGDSIVVDTTILGQEAGGGITSAGMPPSVDNVTANIRIAIPSRGALSSAFFVPQDPVAELNGVDSFGRASVIRDIRSGNLADGRFGTLSDIERPMIVGNLDMGIIDVDASQGVVTLNKRFHTVPVRGRFPFVEGAISATTGLPLGPGAVPTRIPLRSGDFLIQRVEVTMPDGTVEFVRLRAEILQNMDVGTLEGSPNLGRTVSGGQGETSTTVRVKLATVAPAFDSLGREVAFQASALPQGRECVLRAHYYEHVDFLDGSAFVTDRPWIQEFLVLEPRPPRLGSNQQPIPLGTMVDPMSSVAVAFSEPMDLERIDNTHNLAITNATVTGSDFAAMVAVPKVASLAVVPTRQTDQGQDGTLLQLTPDLGHFHVQGTAETYWFHVLLDAAGVTDLAGNTVQIYDSPAPHTHEGTEYRPVPNWSVSYTLDSSKPTNRTGWRVLRFEDVDEDGTPPGSVDVFGQFRISNGRLMAAETVRFSRTADLQNLGGISRANRGECWLAGGTPSPPAGNPNIPFQQGGPPGTLYWTPRMVDQILPPNVPQVFLPPNTPQDVGRIIEPHEPRGSRLMMRYLEDDFTLDYRRATEFMLDVEQLYWSPFNDETVLFDVFDRYTLALSHSDKRPDLTYFINPNGANGPECQVDCTAASSALSATFAANILQGSSQVRVLEDKVYEINPNDAFRAPTGTKFVPYPRFDRTYTWRDSRLITMQNGQVVGLGGAMDPRANPPQNDRTADIDSPWITSQPPTETNNPPAFPPGFPWVLDEGDFRGNRRRDHDPIALPLLVDFRVFPDDARNGIARGINAFQVAYIGPPSAFTANPPAPGGYYNQGFPRCGAPRPPWPWTRVHSTGGLDPITRTDILVDPSNVQVATGGWRKDAGLGDPIQGLFQAPPGDSHLHWAQIDLVRKVSTVTFGMFDTLQPNRHNLPGPVTGQPPPPWANWAGRTIQNGFPDLAALEGGNLRVRDLVTRQDPPVSRQPAGTSVVLEIRGATNFTNATRIYDQVTDDALATRGNLLNPNYACEAYRYSTANSGANGDLPRIEAQGLTQYVTEDQVGLLRNPATGLLPRYLNMRLVLTNNIDVTPAVSPSLRSLSIVYRMAAPN